MANRSYLYAADQLPGSPQWEATRDLFSISEWSYDIPLTYRILLSGNPTPVPSSILGTSEKTALAGTALTGLNRLKAYLERLPAEARPMVEEALEYLSLPCNTRRYFVLECIEIFDMTVVKPEVQNSALQAEIEEMTARLDKLEVPALPSEPVHQKSSLLQRLFGRSQPLPPANPLQAFQSLGLGNWSNVLYFQFADTVA